VKKVYLSLNSNLGNREQMLQDAIDAMNTSDMRVVRVSSVYETEPMDVRNQPWFLNVVVEIETELFPLVLLSRLNKIERQLGRKRVMVKGPRSIDIDILLFEKFIIDTDVLTVPHPRMTERRFVLEPMTELSPELRHPANRRTMRELLAGVSGQQVKRVEISLMPSSASSPQDS
jgi:2-amino-4-hydroxy-6-hydroxymethyldihydropteridine diphosphokinase